MLPYFEKDTKKIYTSHFKHTYDFSSHFHSNVEIAYCLSGFQNIKIGDTIYTLSKGDAVIIFPNIVHEYIRYDSAEDVPTEVIAVISETDFFTNIIPELKTMRPESPFIKAELIPENSALAFRKITYVNDSTELLGWSFIALSGLIKNLILMPIKDSADFKLAPEIIAFINANFQKQLTLKYISREFGYNPSYIAHIFCDQLKIPFRTYLGAVRSDYAANMICTTNKSLTEIAYECGYNSLNTFCRCFKKHFGITPSKYRNHHK